MGGLDQLRKLNPCRAQGPDGIPTCFLRTYVEQLAAPHQDLFQTSINTGEVPQDWREANISSIFKKGDRTVAGNYRPVSLNSVISKIMEHDNIIIQSHIMKHLDSNNILTDYQHGFRAKRLTESQLIPSTILLKN